MAEDKLSHYGAKLLARLSGDTILRRQVDHTEEGIQSGGYCYWIDPGGKRAGPASARELIDKGLVIPLGDGLLDDISQSYCLA